jgi:alpha-amylase
MRRHLLQPLMFMTAAALGTAASCMGTPDYGERPARLETRVADWREEIIYQVLVDRFANAEYVNDINVRAEAPSRYHGGDWKGLEDHLDYFTALGVTTLWISPAVKNIETDAGFDGYHGYWAQDLTKPNPHFGDMVALRRMIAKAHERGLRVVLDIVTNHMGQLFYYDVNMNGQPDILFQESGNKQRVNGGAPIPVRHVTEYDPDFDIRGIQAFTSLGEAGPAPARFIYDPLSNKVPVFPEVLQNDWAYHRRGRVYDYDSVAQTELGDFPGGLKDVATELPEVRDAMVDAYARWVEEVDFDGFRIDTLKHVEHDFWNDFCRRVRERLAAQGKTNFFMFGESFDGDDVRNGSYTKGTAERPLEHGVDSVFYFAQKFQVFDGVFKYKGPTTNISRLREQRFDRPDRPGNYRNTPQPGGANAAPTRLLVNFLDNHDVARFLFQDGTLEALRNALFFMFMWDGLPCIYYGTEQDFNGGNDPANREDFWPTGYRTDGATFQWVARLARLRKAYPTLTKGDVVVRWDTERTGDEEDANMFAFERVPLPEDVTAGAIAPDAYALVVVNAGRAHASSTSFGTAVMTTGLPEGTALVDAVSGQAYTVGAGGALKVTLEPETGALLVPPAQLITGL